MVAPCILQAPSMSSLTIRALLLLSSLALIPVALLLGPLVMSQNDTLTSAQKRQLHEVADGMLEIYQVLADMRYLDPEGIIQGPHDLQHLQGLFEKLNLDPAIIYLYSILPYIDKESTGAYSFFQGGTFSDFRDPDDVLESRDPHHRLPFGESENGSETYMEPWYTSLTRLGNHESVIFYDARKHRIWILDQTGGGSTDLALRDIAYYEEQHENLNSLERYPSRPAADVLRDIKTWFRTVQEIPRGDHTDPEWSDKDLVEEALLKNGWPDHFNGDQFQVDLARLHCASRAQEFADEPMRRVQEIRLSLLDWPKQQAQLSQRIAEAKDLDEEWGLRLELWKLERVQGWQQQQLKENEAKVDRFCGDGVCIRDSDMWLWESELLRIEHKQEQDHIRYLEDRVAGSEDAKDRESSQRMLRSARRKAAVYSRAYKDAKADAERLCPGRTFQEVTGIETLGPPDTSTQLEDFKNRISGIGIEAETLRQWSKQLPEGAVSARALVASELERDDGHIARITQELKDFQK